MSSLIPFRTIKYCTDVFFLLVSLFVQELELAKLVNIILLLPYQHIKNSFLREPKTPSAEIFKNRSIIGWKEMEQVVKDRKAKMGVVVGQCSTGS